jgi:hypothetical protein
MDIRRKLELKARGRCPRCEKHVDPRTEFRDAQSLAEFKISGYCQACQDVVFR